MARGLSIETAGGSAGVRRYLVIGLVLGLLLAFSSALVGAAVTASSARGLSARLTVSEFAISEARSVKVIYKFSKPTKGFSYRLTMKKGSAWTTLRSVDSKGRFRGQKAMRMTKVFGKRWIKPGFYILELRCPGSRIALRFKVVPFAGRLTKKRFTLAEANSITFTYAFSKPSKSFAYRLKMKKGSGWKTLKSYKKTQKKGRYFTGVRRIKLKKVFGKNPFALGSYRLYFSCSYSKRMLKFEIVPEGPGGAGEGGGETSGASFRISGGVSGLKPGRPEPIRLTLTNPNKVPIFVTELKVAISADSTPPGCKSAENIRLTQSSASSANPIAVPANGSVTLTTPPRAPQIEFLDLPNKNQDACKNVSFGLTFSGSAHS